MTDSFAITGPNQEEKAKAAEIQRCEEKFESLSEDIDFGDVYSILAAIATSQNYSSTADFIRNDSLAREIIEMTQSHDERSFHSLIEMAELDDRIAELADEEN